MLANNSWHTSLPESHSLLPGPIYSEIKVILGSASVKTVAELLLLAGTLPFGVWLQLFPVTSLKLAFFFCVWDKNNWNHVILSLLMWLKMSQGNVPFAWQLFWVGLPFILPYCCANKGSFFLCIQHELLQMAWPKVTLLSGRLISVWKGGTCSLVLKGSSLRG